MLPTKFRWQPCLITDRDEMSNLNRGHSIDDSYQVSVVTMFVNDRDEMRNLHRGHSIDASCQVSVHLAKRFQRKRLKKNRPIRNKNCLWRPCLVMDHNKMCTLQRGPSIDASYQVSVHLAEGFQRRSLNVKSKRMTDDRPQMMPKAHIAFGKVCEKRILKCEYLLVMYRINMLHYIIIS